MVFGAYDPSTGADAEGQMTLQIRCPKGLIPRALLSTGSAKVFDPRTMQNGSEILKYNVYLNLAHTQVWGDGSPGSFAWDGPTGNSTLDAFGLIPGGQDVAVGDYADGLTVTILF